MLAITRLEPVVGPTSGGDVVRIEGTGFAPSIAVYFGATPGELLDVFADPASSLAYVRTPAHELGAVDVAIENLDEDSAPAGESANLPAGYPFERAALGGRSDLTRVVRTLLRLLKRDVLATASTRRASSARPS